jgi:cholesterol oxidase
VGVLESGRRWPDEDIPTTSWDVRKFAWQPEAEMYGISAWSFWTTCWCCAAPASAADPMSTATTLYVPPKKFFDAPEWADITDWAGELAPYVDQATRMLDVVRL